MQGGQAPTVQITVPEGAGPGTQIQIMNPMTGQPLMLTIPDGAVPGMTLMVPLT